jgi:hypothetical protein
MCARSAAALLLVGLGATGCAATRGPPGYLRPADVVQREAHGGWITLILPGSTVDGELLAVAADSVFVLMPTGLRVVPRDSVMRAILGGYNAQWGQSAGWTTLGVLGSASHGWYAGISAPLWILVGSLATGAASRAPLRKADGHAPPERRAAQWAAIGLFARFPAGMPDGLDRTTLRSRAGRGGRRR